MNTRLNDTQNCADEFTPDTGALTRLQSTLMAELWDYMHSSEFSDLTAMNKARQIARIDNHLAVIGGAK